MTIADVAGTENCLKAALHYLQKLKWSVIACGKDKRPIGPWKQYQSRRPTTDEVTRWFESYPEANVGIVTGAISGGLGVIDADGEKGLRNLNDLLPDSYLTPIAETQGGGQHIYTKVPRELRNAVRKLPGVDFRGEGGMVIAPPSVGTKGRYRWIISPYECQVAETPEEYIRAAGAERAYEYKYKNSSSSHQGSSGKAGSRMFEHGRRDDDLFHTAHLLTKGGMPESEIYQVLENLIKSWGEKPDPKWIQEKIHSAMNRLKTKEMTMAQAVREWVLSSSGIITSTDFIRLHHFSSLAEHKNFSNIMGRLIDEGLVERYGKKSGVWRVIDSETDEIDFLNAATDTYPVVWPCGIEQYASLMPGNIAVIAGVSNAGKTAYLLNLICHNQDRHRIHYFSSEMAGPEIRKRLEEFGYPLDSWKFRAYERSGDFADVIRPDDFNIVDYLEMTKDFYLIAEHIKLIHQKLRGGICIISIQKNPGTDLGLGGWRGIEKARLYMTIDRGRLSVKKAKHWTTNVNPNGMVLDFSLHFGALFEVTKDWRREDK